jgi:capsular exopolysaccharide synthesis family protein
VTEVEAASGSKGRLRRVLAILRRRTGPITAVSLLGPAVTAAVMIMMARPGSLSPELVTGLSFTVSLAVACVAAVLLEPAERGLRSPAEVEALLELPTLAVVPQVAQLKRDERVHARLLREPDSPYGRAVHSVLEALGGNQPAKVVLVTSALPGEGKTTLAVSLAALAARTGKVLLIDLDLRQPNVHRQLGREHAAGLVEHVMEGRPLSEVLQHDEETGLDFLSVGVPTLDPTELIESERMRQLLETGRAGYDLVVIDCAPVGIITDARIAAVLADKVVFVVQWRSTLASAARDGAQTLRDAGVEPAGVVLTQAVSV